MMKCTTIVLFLFACRSFSFAQNGMSGFSMPSLAPQVQKDGSVLFRLRAPAARQVIVKLESATIPLEKNRNGVWSGMSKKMTPDIYAYTYVVDSLSIVDPSNPSMRSSYGGTGQSLITVPGSPAEKWEL